MGFSARYHAASLAAVFLALAIGILIGSAIGDDVVSGARSNLEDSLIGDLKNARGRADDLSADLGRSEAFANQIYPALVEERLADKRIGILALGALPSDVAGDIDAALAPTGGRVAAVGVIREPPELSSLASDLSTTRVAGLEDDPDAVQSLGAGVGRQLINGGPLIDKLRDQLFARASGDFADLDGIVIVRSQPEDLSPDDRMATNRLETGLLDGIEGTFVTAVGVETEDTKTSSIGFFKSSDVASVDDVDRAAGRVAMVFALLGAQGSFGTKDSADQLLPDLLTPTPPLIEGAPLGAPAEGPRNATGANGPSGATGPSGSAGPAGAAP